jgi:hypothetical protein
MDGCSISTSRSRSLAVPSLRAGHFAAISTVSAVVSVWNKWMTLFHHSCDERLQLQQENPRFKSSGLSDATIHRRLAPLCSYIGYLRATKNPKLRNPIRDLTFRWHQE